MVVMKGGSLQWWREPRESRGSSTGCEPLEVNSPGPTNRNIYVGSQAAAERTLDTGLDREASAIERECCENWYGDARERTLELGPRH